MAFYAEKILQSIIKDTKRPSKCILGMETLCNNASNLFKSNNSFYSDFYGEGEFILEYLYISMISFVVFYHDCPLACKIYTVKTLALRCNSGTSLTIVMNDKNAICC